jgi:hypothetical protein
MGEVMALAITSCHLWVRLDNHRGRSLRQVIFELVEQIALTLFEDTSGACWSRSMRSCPSHEPDMALAIAAAPSVGAFG